ncbi:GTPase Era [Pontibacter sp. G13]|uniref:GTPase Era n=1 Tax=Pontibacter sp. G13 TaxID=3074898 RepID=UPI00288BFD50|nr:GTPase Era [Pontibacter sp. G13]WNJ18871.1 GTPase Era [Pontibacter sp. G13]
MNSTPNHKSGFVSIIGKPNAGKSTLLNAILGQKLSITTAKAQTTRHRIFGIDSQDDYQIVYSDTPGLIRPKYKLHEHMVEYIGQSLEDADIIVLLIALDEKFPEEDLMKLAGKSNIPKILVLNKVDLVSEDQVFLRMKKLMDQVDFVEAIPISALNGHNVPKLKELILENLPEGPAWFGKDQISDRPERFFVSEMIREKIFKLLKDEIPYSTEVSIDEFVEEENISRVSATIHVERKSQKGILIGKQGSMLKKIGTYARQDMEEFLGNKVFLQLFVKVSEGWKNNNRYLRGFGY